ncbi:MAG: GAF domain-containing protein [Chloroflexota bacterium]
MSRKSQNTLVVAILSFVALLGVVFAVPLIEIGIVADRIVELVVYALVTAFALILSVPLSRGTLSIAHAVGLMALLSLPTDTIPAMTVAIFIGGMIGGIFHARTASSRDIFVSIETIARSVAQVTVAYLGAGLVYAYGFSADLPINASVISEEAIPLTITVIVYLILYTLSFLFQVRAEQRLRDIFSNIGLSLAIILLLPVPFAIMAASLARTDESVLFFTITIVGTVLIIFGFFVLTRSQYRLQRQLDEMRSLSVATQAMRGNLDLDALLRTTYVQVSQLLDTRNFTVGLYNEVEMRMDYPLVIREGDEINVPAGTFPIDYLLIEYLIETGESLLIDTDMKTRTEALNIPQPERIASWLGVPLVNGERAIGVFAVQSYDDRSFDTDDLRLLNIFVASTSIAIENARLYQQKSTRAEQLATLNKVTTLLTETLAPDKVLDMVISSASTISDGNGVAVFLYTDKTVGSLALARFAGMSDIFAEQPILPLLAENITKIEQDAFVKPQSLVIQNLDDVRVHDNRARFTIEDKQAFIEHPLYFGSTILGILVIYYEKPQIYTPEQIDILQAFATQAGQAINNAQRFTSADKALEQRVEQLYALAAMGRLLNASLETDKIYEVVLTYATDATKAPRGLVAVYTPHGQLSVPAQKGYPDDMFGDSNFLQQGLTGRVLDSGQTMRISDTRAETGYLPLMPKTRSLIITPIMKGKETLGLILLESNMQGAFSEGDGHFVSQIANQAVIAADNTLLFQRVREARDNMQVILDAMEEGIILLDGDGTVALANPHIDMIGLAPSDILGNTVGELLEDSSLSFAQKLGFRSPDGLRKLVKMLRDNWEQPVPHDFEIHGDDFGVRYVQRQVIPVRDDSKYLSGMLLVFYNVSDERELSAARESLSQMIVHDLRSPLTAVTTSLRLLQELVPKDADFAPLVEKTTSTSRRAIRKVLTRVDSLLDISKMESGSIRLEREQSNLRQIAESVRTELNPLAAELDVTIEIDIPISTPSVYIDADKIERMVLNLVDNALKYSPADGIVMIRTEVDKAHPETIIIAVSDQGPGIPDDYKRQLFDRFVQIEGRKTVRRGVGLGLTFCKLVTEAHNGRIWVDDNEGSGSVFKAAMPIVAQYSELVSSDKDRGETISE